MSSAVNVVRGPGNSALEIHLDGSKLYALTDLVTSETPVWTHNLGFSVSSGQTLEFRSQALSGGTASFASSVATISDFTLASAIPDGPPPPRRFLVSPPSASPAAAAPRPDHARDHG